MTSTEHAAASITVSEEVSLNENKRNKSTKEVRSKIPFEMLNHRRKSPKRNKFST